MLIATGEHFGERFARELPALNGIGDLGRSCKSDDCFTDPITKIGDLVRASFMVGSPT